MTSITWAAWYAVARCGRPSRSASATSTTPRPQSVPSYGGRTYGSGANGSPKRAYSTGASKRCQEPRDSEPSSPWNSIPACLVVLFET